MLKQSSPIPVPGQETPDPELIIVLPETLSIKILDPFDSSTPISTPPSDFNMLRNPCPLPSQHTPTHTRSAPSPFNQTPYSPVCGWISQNRGPTGIHCGNFQTKFASDLMVAQLAIEENNT